MNESNKRPFQFTVRTIGVSIALICIVAAWFARRPYLDLTMKEFEINMASSEIKIAWDIWTTRYDVKYQIFLGDEVARPIQTAHIHPRRVGEIRTRTESFSLRHDFGNKDALYFPNVGTAETWKRPVLLLQPGERLRVTSTPRRFVRVISLDGQPLYYWIQTR